jgi:hypothetical protein
MGCAGSSPAVWVADFQSSAVPVAPDRYFSLLSARRVLRALQCERTTPNRLQGKERNYRSELSKVAYRSPEPRTAVRRTTADQANFAQLPTSPSYEL